jgi:hypothetical protein
MIITDPKLTISTLAPTTKAQAKAQAPCRRLFSSSPSRADSPPTSSDDPKIFSRDDDDIDYDKENVHAHNDDDATLFRHTVDSCRNQAYVATISQDVSSYGALPFLSNVIASLMRRRNAAFVAPTAAFAAAADADISPTPFPVDVSSRSSFFRDRGRFGEEDEASWELVRDGSDESLDDGDASDDDVCFDCIVERRRLGFNDSDSSRPSRIPSFTLLLSFSLGFDVRCSPSVFSSLEHYQNCHPSYFRHHCLGPNSDPKMKCAWRGPESTICSVCMYDCLYICMFLYVSLSRSVSVCLSVCLPACMPVCLPACLPVSLSVSLSFTFVQMFWSRSPPG